MTQNKNKRVIAVTGGIGCGKSVVCNLLSRYGDVLSCDEINREMLLDANYIRRLKERFPEALINGTPDKRVLATLIFNNKEKRAELNAIAHPEIMKRLLKKIEEASSDLVFVEVPLLAGSGFAKLFKEIIVVHADEHVRLKRIAERDHITKAEAQKRIDAQNTPLVFSGAITYYIDNTGDMETLNNNCKNTIEIIQRRIL